MALHCKKKENAETGGGVMVWRYMQFIYFGINTLAYKYILNIYLYMFM